MANKNVKISTEEVKLQGLLNADNIEEGVILIEADGNEINLCEYLKGLNGSDIELNLKKKIEQPIV